MKILHVDFSGPYTENMSYQENLLPEVMSADGNDVYMYVTCFEWKDGVIKKTHQVEKSIGNGVKLKRFEYLNICGGFLTEKLRFIPRFQKTLENLSPDIIMLHCPQTLTSISICKYVDSNPKVKLVADNHSDHHNSATSFASRFFLHRIIYKPLMRMVYKRSEQVYCITTEVKDFVSDIYKLDEKKLKILPLGGIIPSDDEYRAKAKEIRNNLGFKDEDILIVNSGKIDASKKTDILIDAFYKANPNKCRLVILGKPDNDMLPIIDEKVSDPQNQGRVYFLGWKNANELMQFLCAADVYAQPGGMSATFQNAICCRCAVVSYPHKSYMDSYVDGNGLWAENEEELVNAIKFIDTHPDELRKMQDKSEEIAREKLDYVKQGRMIIQDCFG